jgi:hypothetical protein
MLAPWSTAYRTNPVDVQSRASIRQMQDPPLLVAWSTDTVVSIVRASVLPVFGDRLGVAGVCSGPAIRPSAVARVVFPHSVVADTSVEPCMRLF